MMKESSILIMQFTSLSTKEHQKGSKKGEKVFNDTLFYSLSLLPLNLG
jgi:hypothetical protein